MAKAKKQQKLNKNLIALLTAVGMALTVGVVSFAAYSGSHRDPELFAKPAREFEKKGEYDKAIELYMRSFKASEDTEVKYLLDASRCFFEVGDFGRSFQCIRQANSEAPDNKDVLLAALNFFWRFIDTVGEGSWADLRDYARLMLKLDKDNVYALVSLSRALDQLGEKTPEGKEALDRAIQLAPNDPRVAIRRIGAVEAEMYQAEKAHAGPEVMAEYKKKVEDAAAKLQEAIAASPGDPILCGAYVRYLLNLPTKDFERAEQSLRNALGANSASPILHYQLALLILSRMEEQRDKLTPEQFDNFKRAAIESCRKSIELEPAMFEAMVTHAELELARRPGQERLTDEDYERGLKLYDQYARETRQMKGVRPMLVAPTRLQLVLQGYQTALIRFSLAGNDEAKKAERLKAAEYFLDDAEVKYPDKAFTHYMRGKHHLAKEDVRNGIKSFERAYELQPKAAFWVTNFNIPLTEQLALLYFQIRQYGEAEKYFKKAKEDYRELGKSIPLRFAIAEVDLLVQLNRYQLAYDQANDVLAAGRNVLTPEQRARITQQRVYCLKQLDRPEEVKAVVESETVAQETVRGQLVAARIAASEKQYDQAEKLLSGILINPESKQSELADALQLYAAVMSDSNRREAGQRFLQQLEAKATVEDYKRSIRGFSLMLAEANPDKRSKVLEEFLKSEPDEYTRYSNLVVFYTQRKETDKAAEALDQKEKVRPDDPESKQQQFYMALKQKKYDRATSYLTFLQSKNVDGAEGATFRAELALAQGRPEEAIRELKYAISKLPRSSKLHTGMARAYIDMNRREEAIQQLDEAISINPRDFIAQRSLFVLFHQAAGRAMGAEKDKAVKRRDEAMKATAVLPEAENDKEFQDIKEYLEEESNPRVAIETREKRRAQDPKDVVNLVRLGQLYAKLWEEAHTGNQDLAPQLGTKATECLEAAMALEPGNSYLIQVSAAFFGWRGDRAAGEKVLNNYLKAVTGTAKIYGTLIMGGMYEQLFDYETAEAKYREAMGMVKEIVGKDGPDAVRRAEIQVGFETMDYFARRKLHTKLIETCRWVLERLDSKKESEIPSIQQARLLLVDGLLKAKQMADAEKEVQQFVKDYSGDIRGKIALASLRLNQNKREEAYNDLTAILKDQPENVWAMHNRGVVSLQRSRYTEAKNDLERAAVLIDREPRLELPLRSRLAVLYEAIGQPDLAEKELNQMLILLDRQAASSEAKDACVDRILRLYVRSGRLEEAQKVISGYMEKRPTDPIWPYYFGKVNEDRATQVTFEANLARQAGNASVATAKANEARTFYGTAARYHKMALEREAQSRDPRVFTLATTAQISSLCKSGKPADAVTVFNQIPAERRTPMIRASAVEALAATNNAAKATEEALGAFLDAGRESLALTLGVSNALAPLMNPQDLENLLKRAFETARDTPEQSMRVGAALISHMNQSGKHQDSGKFIDAVIGNAAFAKWEERADVLLMKAGSRELAKDHEGAITAYKAMIEQFPNDLMALNNIAWLLATEVSRPKEALQYADKSRQLALDDPESTAGRNPRLAGLLDTVGWVYFKNGMYPEAVAALEEALVYDPDLLPAYDHLGQAYVAVGRNGDARTAYSKGVALAEKLGEAGKPYLQRLQEGLQKLK